MRVLFWGLLSGSVLALAACTHSPEAAKFDVNCDFGDTKFSTSFEAARLHGCRKTATNTYDLLINPEDSPINPSAWYAFDISAPAEEVLNLTLVYAEGYHRYPIKKRIGAGVWEQIETRPDPKAKTNRHNFTIETDGDPVRIAAQPIFDTAKHLKWVEDMTELEYVNQNTIGQSVENRPIIKLEEVDNPNKPYVLIVGRQHPPETTGADALMPFVEAIWEDTEQAKNFRSQYNLIVVPLLNPDGVFHGNWRHNMNGVDLNRDWGPFTQPETQAIQTELQRFENGSDRIVAFVDFHSTWRNLLYTQTENESASPDGFTKEWINIVDEKLDDEVYAFTREQSPNEGKPTSKNYMNSQFGITAVTYEVGDHTEISATQLAAKQFAETFMELFLRQSEKTENN